MKQKTGETDQQSKDNKTKIRVQAVFAMFKGESVKEVSKRFEICRTSLYKLRRQAIGAVRCEIERPIERKFPAHNRLLTDKENKVVKWCERHPTLSSYCVSEKLSYLENETVSPRTVQRIRKRHALPRVPKRPVPTFKAHRFSVAEKDLIRQKIKEKMYLGGERLAWDLQNQCGIRISPSTAKRIKQNILSNRSQLV